MVWELQIALRLAAQHRGRLLSKVAPQPFSLEAQLLQEQRELLVVILNTN